MAYTRAEGVARVQDLMDAAGSSKWSSTAGQTGELQRALSVAVDREWRRILQAQPYMRADERTIVSDATTGRYAISDLNSGSGNTTQRLYRVLSFVVDNIPYEFAVRGDHVMAEFLGLSPRVWWREGDNIMAMPKEFTKTATVWVNHIPCRVDQLADDADDITFPDGYEDIPFLMAAASLLKKGGEETAAAKELREDADELRADMLDDIARPSIRPIFMKATDFAYEWGG